MPPSPLALAMAARTIRDYLAVLHDEEQAVEEALLASGEHHHHHHHHHTASQGLASLLRAQLLDILSPPSPPGSSDGRHAPRSSTAWTFSYREDGRGATAVSVLALLQFWTKLVERRRCSCVTEEQRGLMQLAMDCLVNLVRRDASAKHLLVRQWQENCGTGSLLPPVPLQTWCLYTYADWRRCTNNSGEADVTAAELVSLLRLWALLASRQLLNVQAVDYSLLSSCLLGPVYQAASSPVPLSPTRRRSRQGTSSWDGQEEESTEEEDPNLLLLPSLHLLAHAARGSPSFRLFLKALNQREDGALLDTLLSLVVSAQSQASTTRTMALATLGALSRLVAGHLGWERKAFDNQNVQLMARLVFSCLLQQHREDDGADDDEEDHAGAAVDLLEDMLRSPLVLSRLEEEEEEEEEEEDDDEGGSLNQWLPALAASLNGERRGDDACYAPVLRSLWLACQESALGQRLLVQHLLLDPQALTRVLVLALSLHPPTAAEAVELLQRLASLEGARAWQAFALVAKARVSHGNSSSSSSFSLATAQLYQRSPVRRHKPTSVVATTWLDQLTLRLHALANEVEVESDGDLENLELTGTRITIDAAAILELEAPLRPLLSLADSLMSTGSLAADMAARLDPRALSALVLGMAHPREGERADPMGGAAPPCAVKGRSCWELVVLGCRLLLEGTMALQSRRLASDRVIEQETEEEEEEEEGKSVRGTPFTSAHYRHWLQVVLGSGPVVDALYVATQQGTDRGLLAQALGFLTSLANHRGRNGPQWCWLVDTLLERNQARTACVEALEERLRQTEATLEDVAIDRDVKASIVEDADGQRAALQAAHEEELVRVGQDWREDVVALKKTTKDKEAEHQAQTAVLVRERDTWRRRAEDAEARLAQEQHGQRASKEETAALRAQVQALNTLLHERKAQATRHEARATSLELEIERYQQEAQRNAAAEQAVQQADAKLQEVFAKLTALTQAHTAKEEEGARQKERLHSLHQHVLQAEQELAGLRGRLAEAEGHAQRMEALRQAEATQHDLECRQAEKEMERILEDVSALQALVEIKTDETKSLEHQHQYLQVRLAQQEKRLAEQNALLRKQRHAAALIQSLAAAGPPPVGKVNDDDDEEEEEEEGRQGCINYE